MADEYRDRIHNLLNELNQGLYEREHILASTLLAVLSGQSVFLYGPPGTAKSLVARRISSAFEDSNYFEYLMQRFSTPEEVFGPISISELKKDNYVRKTEGYLPTADLAFLDEIWKSSPAILNTLLTIINERRFKNGSDVLQVPLKALISASNEFPQPNSGLDALYDRFIVRLCVNPTEDRENFHKVISSTDVKSFVKPSRPITLAEWNEIRNRASSIPISDGVFAVIDSIKDAVYHHNLKREMAPIYVSDRRWQKAMELLKVASLLEDRKEVTVDSTLILSDCLWSSEEDREVILKIVADSMIRSKIDDKDLQNWEKRFQEAKDDLVSAKAEAVARARQAADKKNEDRGVMKWDYNRLEPSYFDDHVEISYSDAYYGSDTKAAEISYQDLASGKTVSDFKGTTIDIGKQIDGIVEVSANFKSDSCFVALPAEYSNARISDSYKQNLRNLKKSLDSIVDNTVDRISNLELTDSIFTGDDCRSVLEGSAIRCVESMEELSKEITDLINSL